MSLRGGKREGAGRPAGNGKFKGESTKTIRIPVSRFTDIQALLEGESLTYSIPIYTSKVQAGFPSPGDDYIERHLDLNHHLIRILLQHL